jgi:hypothetical protein
MISWGWILKEFTTHRSEQAYSYYIHILILW